MRVACPPMPRRPLDESGMASNATHAPLWHWTLPTAAQQSVSHQTKAPAASGHQQGGGDSHGIAYSRDTRYHLACNVFLNCFGIFDIFHLDTYVAIAVKFSEHPYRFL